MLGGIGFVLVVAFGLGLAVVAYLVSQQRIETAEDTYRSMLASTGLAATDTPMGLDDEQLVRFELLPSGDRDCSAVWGVLGDVAVTLAGVAHRLPASAFEWWWEDRQTSTDANGHTQTTWVRRSMLAALVALPPELQGPRVRITEEGFFASLGIGKGGDFRVESDAFNRAFDVRVADPALGVRLLDAGFQQALLAQHAGRSFELDGPWLLVEGPAPRAGGDFRRGGEPGFLGIFGHSGDRASKNPQTILAVPGMLDSATWLLELVPDGYWRGLQERETGQPWRS